jgi:hypothetical protein
MHDRVIAALEPRLIWAATLVCGVMLALMAPRLARTRLYLPPPRTPFGRGALTVALEALAAGVVVSALRRLLPLSSLDDGLSLFGTLAFIACCMALLGGALAEITMRQQHDEF